MYRVHYSTDAIVTHFLIRLEPFTTLAIELQEGHFDCPDRLFRNVPSSWCTCTTLSGDVKELIPEWYCLPEMFQNSNDWDLGELQNHKGRVHHVTLPKWAYTQLTTSGQRIPSASPPHEFVRMMRAALESEYVSKHLHNWIDLIFGHKQRPPTMPGGSEECVKADNVFEAFTYEGFSYDENDEDVVKQQIKLLGQTPTQLLTEPHLKRLPLEECQRPLCYDVPSIDNLRFFALPKHARPDGHVGAHGRVEALTTIQVS